MAPLIIMAGPSGVGKTTMAEKLLAAFPPLSRVVTITTRPPRPNERHGIDYFFVTLASFRQLQSAQAFLEVNEFNGFLYGTPRSLLHLLDRGYARLILPDIHGARSLVALKPQALAFWLDAPQEVLAARLAKRNTEAPEKQAARLAIATEERAAALGSGLFPHQIDMTDFNDAYVRITALVQPLIHFDRARVVVP